VLRVDIRTNSDEFVMKRKLTGFNNRDCMYRWHKKTETFEKPNKNWRNPRKKIYWQKL